MEGPMKRFRTLARWFIVIMLILGALDIAGYEVPIERLREPVSWVAAIERPIWDLFLKVVETLFAWAIKAITTQAAT
jgi:hypothetical protein